MFDVVPASPDFSFADVDVEGVATYDRLKRAARTSVGGSASEDLAQLGIRKHLLHRHKSFDAIDRIFNQAGLSRGIFTKLKLFLGI